MAKPRIDPEEYKTAMNGFLTTLNGVEGTLRQAKNYNPITGISSAQVEKQGDKQNRIIVTFKNGDKKTFDFPLAKSGKNAPQPDGVVSVSTITVSNNTLQQETKVSSGTPNPAPIAVIKLPTAGREGIAGKNRSAVFEEHPEMTKKKTDVSYTLYSKDGKRKKLDLGVGSGFSLSPTGLSASATLGNVGVTGLKISAALSDTSMTGLFLAGLNTAVKSAGLVTEFTGAQAKAWGILSVLLPIVGALSVNVKDTCAIKSNNAVLNVRPATLRNN